jgi:hypothetical protein
MARKAKQREYGEKKSGKTYGLTPTAAAMLDELAKEFGVSSSHLIEKIARRELALSMPLGEYLTSS